MTSTDDKLEHLRKNYLRAKAIGSTAWMAQIQRDAEKLKAQQSEKTAPDSFEFMKELVDKTTP